MGGERDFQAFYRTTYARLVGQVRTLTGDLETAEDAVQEAFVRAAGRWRQVRAYEVPEHWVRKTAFRLAVDALRRARRHARKVHLLQPTGHVPAVEPVDDELLAALQRLPLPTRAAIVLHHCLDLPVEEVAVQLGVPTGTVKSRLTRGRARLLDLLGGSPAGSPAGAPSRTPIPSGDGGGSNARR
jgi:RNA polymerase sigma-70 factor (ECF subfamily)